MKIRAKDLLFKKAIKDPVYGYVTQVRDYLLAQAADCPNCAEENARAAEMLNYALGIMEKDREDQPDQKPWIGYGGVED